MADDPNEVDDQDVNPLKGPLGSQAAEDYAAIHYGVAKTGQVFEREDDGHAKYTTSDKDYEDKDGDGVDDDDEADDHDHHHDDDDDYEDDYDDDWQADDDNDWQDGDDLGDDELADDLNLDDASLDDPDQIELADLSLDNPDQLSGGSFTSASLGLNLIGGGDIAGPGISNPFNLASGLTPQPSSSPLLGLQNSGMSNYFNAFSGAAPLNQMPVPDPTLTASASPPPDQPSKTKPQAFSV